MNNVYCLLISLFIISSCSFKIPPGNYTTADGPSFAVHNFTFKENGRFKYNFSSDDGHPDIGHGGYIIIGNNVLFLFENSNVTNTKYVSKEIPCTVQDSQVVNIKVLAQKGDPLIGASIFNIDNNNQGLVTQIDGTGHITLLKESKKRSFQIHYIGFEDLIFEFEGDKCYNIDVLLNNEIDQLKRGDFKIAKLKTEGDKMLIKMNNWRDYDTLYLKEN